MTEELDLSNDSFYEEIDKKFKEIDKEFGEIQTIINHINDVKI